MTKDIELLKELKERIYHKTVTDSRRMSMNTIEIIKRGEYIRALSNAIQMMEEAENDTEV